ncbi:hypothetical protein PVAND_017143 [Polypedilum vanderplanki]|uniref:Gustatory receptor n=1 Tax=Polypedilum vanderplanki TaxID=319348 RepID=A0A9J6BI90_POLVA|nr:hypothetical protein PVAND_017143 [Polypedilum vanderplanki]
MLTKITKTISSFTLISRFAGFLLFSINYQTETVIITKLNAINILFTILINCCFTSIFWMQLLPIFDNRDVIMKTVVPLLLCGDHYVNIFIIIWLFSKRRRICEALKVLCNIDEKFEEIGVKIDHKKYKRTIDYYTMMVFGIFIGVFSFGLITTIPFGSYSSYFSLAFSVWCFLLDLAFMFQYILSIAVIGVKFEKLNKNLNKIGENQIIQQIHMEIAKYIYKINKIFGPTLIASFAIIFCWGCFAFFEIITIEKKLINIYDILSYIINLAVTFLCFYFLFTSAAKTEKERKIAINKMFIMMQDHPEKRELYQKFMLQLVHVNVTFECGMFEINWKFLYHLVATAAMYFIILLQFHMSSKNSFS